jgi:hypothetical protein
MAGRGTVSSLDLELDTDMDNLELELRQAYESSIVARIDHQTVAAGPKTHADVLDIEINSTKSG